MPDWRCHADRGLPLNTEQAWDGGQAHQHMMDRAGIGGDNPDFEKARQGYLLVDDSAKENRTAYSLPFADVLDGTLTALITGCRAASSRLPQKQGVSDAERNKARAVLDVYFAKSKPKEAMAADLEFAERPFAFPLRVLSVEERKTERSVSADELLKLARARAQDPSIFEEFPPTFFPAAVSTSKLDSYFTKMARSSLENFARDMAEGVSFQDSHAVNKLGIGQTLSGEFVGPGGNGLMRAVGDIMTLSATQDAADFIQKLRAGIVRDVSAGFYLGPDGKYVCDLCGADIGRGFHEHWPGMTYDMDGQSKLSTWTIEGAHLAEVSAVYDGATPGAVILKARSAAEAGELPPELARSLEVQYRIKLPASHRSWAGFEPKGEEDMPPETPGAVAPNAEEADALAPVRTLLAEAQIQVTDPVEGVRALFSEVQSLRPLKEEVERLRPLADDGRAYRSDLIEETLAEGVRALGQIFRLESQRAMLADQPLSIIKEQREMWLAMAAERLKGGRLTTDPDLHPKADPGRFEPSLPNAAFRA